MTPIVLVLAKAPLPGFAKTRLCPPATLDEAADIAAAALLDTLDAVRATPGVQPVVAMTGELDRAARAAQLRRALSGLAVLAQRGSTFGARLAAAHADTATSFPGRPVLQIGADTPQVYPALLAVCLDRLAAADAVLGPATDGGWWALGLRDPRHAVVLAGVPTSRPDTGERTRLALATRGLRIATLPQLSDVDIVADALAVARQIPQSRFAAAVNAVLAGARGGGQR
ncbi:MAG TPA: DUF2064 domain-containing protein [Micromonosporaceae bacterium]|jgi:hypothetical protein|nr:DUF2064 domain-containing protein [Micromonosporaceae bacterium]